MINGYVLGDQKLSRKAFSNKYWMGGREEYIYQFHTMDIEDGLTERQQLLINNDRALYDLINNMVRRGVCDTTGLYGIRNRIQAVEKTARTLMFLQLISVGAVTLRFLLRFLTRKQ